MFPQTAVCHELLCVLKLGGHAVGFLATPPRHLQRGMAALLGTPNGGAFLVLSCGVE